MTETQGSSVEPSREVRKWAMLCHLIAMVGMLGNGIGFLLGPLVVWLLKKEDHPFVDDQGKEAVNSQITMLLALLISVPLMLVIIGIFTAILAAILMTILPIFAAVRANDGITYRYPLSIRFIK